MKTTDKLAMLIAAAGLATSFSVYADEGEVNLAQVAQVQMIEVVPDEPANSQNIETAAAKTQEDEISKFNLLHWFL